MKFRLSRKAEEDLEGIWLYTLETWSKEQADRYLSLILMRSSFYPLTQKRDKTLIKLERIIATLK